MNSGTDEIRISPRQMGLQRCGPVPPRCRLWRRNSSKQDEWHTFQKGGSKIVTAALHVGPRYGSCHITQIPTTTACCPVSSSRGWPSPSASVAAHSLSPIPPSRRWPSGDNWDMKTMNRVVSITSNTPRGIDDCMQAPRHRRMGSPQDQHRKSFATLLLRPSPRLCWRQ